MDPRACSNPSLVRHPPIRWVVRPTCATQSQLVLDAVDLRGEANKLAGRLSKPACMYCANVCAKNSLLSAAAKLLQTQTITCRPPDGLSSCPADHTATMRQEPGSGLGCWPVWRRCRRWPHTAEPWSGLGCWPVWRRCRRWLCHRRHWRVLRLLRWLRLRHLSCHCSGICRDGRLPLKRYAKRRHGVGLSWLQHELAVLATFVLVHVQQAQGLALQVCCNIFCGCRHSS